MNVGTVNRMFTGAARHGMTKKDFFGGLGALGVPLIGMGAEALAKTWYTFPDFPRISLASGVRGIDSPTMISNRIMHLQGRSSRMRRMIR